MSQIREWALERRAAAMQVMERARVRIEVYDEILVRLAKANGADVEPIEEPVLEKPRPVTGGLADALAKLTQAAGEGVSATELAAIQKVPAGTASSRLSVLKKQGFAILNDHRYFALHSKPDDNSLDFEGKP